MEELRCIKKRNASNSFTIKHFMTVRSFIPKRFHPSLNLQQYKILDFSLYQVLMTHSNWCQNLSRVGYLSLECNPSIYSNAALLMKTLVLKYSDDHREIQRYIFFQGHIF